MLDQAAAELEALVELAPEDPRARVGLATTLVLSREYARARDVLDESGRRFPDHPALQDLQARYLATCPDAKLRDGRRALEIAQRLVERLLTVEHVETLAMALAEVGRFDDAILWQQRALERQASTGAPTAASRRRLEQYQTHHPVREPWNDSVAAEQAGDPVPR